jgi:CheY-like chemotaxis protein
VESRPGTGTTVRVLLPMLREQPPVHAVPASSAQLMPRGSETVLVVDDDARVRTMTANVLADLGYRTLSAPSGSAALELAARHDGPIHLAIVDVAMPKMTGTELAERLAAARPLTKVLFASGYADSPAVRDAVQAQRAVFLTKPYTVPDLARRVRRLLDAPD